MKANGCGPVKTAILRRILMAVGFSFLFVSLLLLAFAFNRSLLDYNDEGRYFDEESGVVYTDSAVGGCAGLGVACIVFALVFLIAAKVLGRLVPCENSMGAPGDRVRGSNDVDRDCSDRPTP